MKVSSLSYLRLCSWSAGDSGKHIATLYKPYCVIFDTDQSGFLGTFILWQTGKEIFGICTVHLDPLRVNSYSIVESVVFLGGTLSLCPFELLETDLD